MHSNQKETLWQECVEGAENESWALLRRYGVAIWLDNLEPLKKKLEKIALE
jgi:hypothetical protein